jgi:biopolymer transport protein ExbB
MPAAPIPPPSPPSWSRRWTTCCAVKRPDPGLLREIVEGEGGRQATIIQNQTQYLLDIAVIAPMVGLLGTVMGMLKAFNAVALDLAKAKPMLLAGGVSQALITTVAGLIVAIPAMMAYAYFRGRTSRIVSDLESSRPTC